MTDPKQNQNGQVPADNAETGDDASVKAAKEKHVFDSTCGVCGALMPTGSAACLVCGTARGEVPYKGGFPVPSAEAPPPIPHPGRGAVRAARRTPQVWQRWSGGLASVILLVFVVLAGFGIYRQYFDTSSHRAGEAVMYESEGRRLMLSHPGLERPMEVTGIIRPAAGYAQGQLCASPNGRWIAYTEETGELYLIDLAQRGIIDGDTITAAKLAQNLAQPAVFSGDSDYLVYLTGDDGLYASDLVETWPVDTGVQNVMAVDDHKVLYTRRGDRGDQVDLYLNYLPKDGGEWLLIDRGVTAVLDWTNGFEKVLYTSIRQDTDNNDTSTLQLFSFAVGKSTTKTLASGIGKVLDASAEKETAIFLVAQPQQWSYEDFIDDDLAEEDSKIEEPDLEDYPLVAAAVALYGEGGDFTDMEDNEELVLENGRYKQAVAAWEDKQIRDEVRRNLHYAFVTNDQPVVLGDLYVYQNATVALLDTGVWEQGDLTPEEGRVSAEKGYVAYQKIDPATLRRMQMSNLWARAEMQSPDLRDYFFRYTERKLMLCRLTGGVQRLYTRSENSMFKQWRVSPAADGVYFTVGSSIERVTMGDTLYYASVWGGSAVEAVLVERDVNRIDWPLRDGVLFEAGERGERQLYYAQSGAARVLGNYGAVGFPPVNEGNTLLYLDNYVEQTGSGDLYMHTRENRMIAANVAGFEYHSDELLYLFKWDESRDAKDIYIWQGGRETLVERHVRSVLGIPANRE